VSLSPNDKVAVQQMIYVVEGVIDNAIRDHLVTNGPIVATLTVYTTYRFGTLVQDRIRANYIGAGWSGVGFLNGLKGVTVALRA
jgi:hypothetical protein